ncbi:hypothetical protein EDC94DRAFT_622036 [Helicostylum pulchrum]|uniref:SAM domain-containing protein n=1 Tax=Helicostylum pulchrum TaxID=562976 RepID=A0ABP9XPA8_9FUNG|nr:hypothetical protein EDC94DRAFT_622036 [Helicostylum pulchrum]
MQHPSDFGLNSNNRTRIPPVDRNSSADVNRLSTWYEDLEEYEGNLEAMASANLDQSFQDELQHVNQWFGYLTDAEKTATLYTLLQHSSQVQIRFFIHLLQEMRKPKPILRASDRASNLINLNRRVPTQPTQPMTSNRHSFALGDTEELSRMFNTMGTDWNTNDQTRIPSQANATNLRPKSVMELGGNTGDASFSNSWLNQRQPTLFNNHDHIIERPHSADISSWPVQPPSSWKPLTPQHDLTWKEPQRFSQIVPETSHSSSLKHDDILRSGNSNISSLKHDEMIRNGGSTALKHDDIIRSSRRASMNPMNNRPSGTTTGGFPHYLSPQLNSNATRRSSAIETGSDSMLGYGSDQSDQSSRYRNNMSSAPPPTTINENKDDDIDMELLKDVTAWFRSLRLHKYNSVFEHMRWQDIIKLDDQALQAKGVAALGARRKMLKVFENVREHCKQNHIEY